MNASNSINKIAVLRSCAMGDFIVTLPAIEALRASYPGAEIILLGRPWQKEFLIKGRTPIDRVLVMPAPPEDQTLFIEAVRAEKIDLLISFQGNGRTATPFLQQLGAKYTIGAVPHWQTENKPDRFHEFYYYQSETIRYLDTVSLAGATPVTLEPSLRIMPEDEEEAAGLLSTLQHKPFVVLHPVATDKRRMWPLENYPALVSALKQRELEVVFSGSEADKPVIDELIAQQALPAINSCTRFGLGGLVAMLSKATLVIGADTGPLHMARAVNTPTVGIYWAPNLINWGPVTRVIHRPVVSWEMHCPLCGIMPNDPYPFEPAGHCQHEVSFVRNVTVQQVMQAADSLLQLKHKEVPTFN